MTLPLEVPGRKRESRRNFLLPLLSQWVGTEFWRASWTVGMRSSQCERRFWKVHLEKENYLIISWFQLLLKPEFWSVSSTVNSRFKKVNFSFLKSRVVWFKKNLWSDSKNWPSEKNVLCRWICNLRSFLNREFTVVLLKEHLLQKILSKWW